MIHKIEELPSLKLYPTVVINAVEGNVEMSIVRYTHEPFTHESLRNIYRNTYYILYDYQEEKIAVFDEWHNNFDEHIPLLMINNKWDGSADWGLGEYDFKWLGATLISKNEYKCPSCGTRSMVRDYVAISDSIEILHECPECSRQFIPLAKDGE